MYTLYNVYFILCILYVCRYTIKYMCFYCFNNKMRLNKIGLVLFFLPGPQNLIFPVNNNLDQSYKTLLPLITLWVIS